MTRPTLKEIGSGLLYGVGVSLIYAVIYFSGYVAGSRDAAANRSPSPLNGGSVE